MQMSNTYRANKSALWYQFLYISCGDLYLISWTRSASSITSFVTGRGVGGGLFTEMQITPKYEQIELANAIRK